MEQRESIIDVHSCSKIQKNSTSDLVDRISALPDSILGVILSFLPTKDSVSTAFLSKRWKFVWLLVRCLDFYHDGCSKALVKDEDIKFIRFVNRVLHLHDVGSLNKFRLTWNPRHISSSHVSSWITIAFKRNVHQLSLCVETPNNGPFDIPEIFVTPITCGSLQSLELKGGISVSAAIVDCFPRLESLKLVSVVFESEEAFEKLISGCPMLNYLQVHAEDDDDFTYIISSTSLTCLELCFNYYSNYIEYTLKLDASSIEYLKIDGLIYEIFVQKSLSSLVEANLSIDGGDLGIYQICDSIGEAFRAFDCAKALNLSNDVVHSLCESKIEVLAGFKRLVKLEASTWCGRWKSLQYLIQSSESLEVLIIHQNPDLCDGSDCNHLSWTSPIEVPRCLSKSLKKITIDGYCGFEDECEMISYLLKHGSVVESMNIHCDRSRVDEEFELLTRVCKFPRKSPSCQLKFFEWNV